MGQRVMGHGSNGSTNVNGSRGPRVTKCDQLSALIVSHELGVSRRTEGRPDGRMAYPKTYCLLRKFFHWGDKIILSLYNLLRYGKFALMLHIRINGCVHVI